MKCKLYRALAICSLSNVSMSLSIEGMNCDRRKTRVKYVYIVSNIITYNIFLIVCLRNAALGGRTGVHSSGGTGAERDVVAVDDRSGVLDTERKPDWSGQSP